MEKEKIYSRYMDGLSFRELAAEFGVSRTKVMKLFKDNNWKKRNDSETSALAAGKRESTNIEKYGCKAPAQNSEVILKMKETNIERYGATCSLHCEKTSELTRRTNLERYGYESASTSQEIKDKIKQTVIERFGTENPMQSTDIVSKQSRTMIERYGGKTPMQCPEIREKIEETNLKKYGERNYLSTLDAKQKRESTLQKRYGVNNPLSCPEISVRSVETKLKRQLERMKERISRFGYEFIDEYSGQNLHSCGNYSGRVLYKIRHSCGHVFEDEVFSMPRCPVCFPHQGGTSQIEKFWSDKISSICPVENNDRKVLNGQEIGILLKEGKIGFEINGLFYHSSHTVGRNKNKTASRHLKKTTDCMTHGIRLFHIWEDNDPVITWSRIRSVLGLFERKLQARKLPLAAGRFDDFFNSCHSMGSTNAAFQFALVSNSKIEAAISFRKKGKDMEIARYACSLDTVVVGGFARLLKAGERHILENYPDVEKIISYAETDWTPDPDACVYKRNGFVLIGHTGPGLFYTNFKRRWSRETMHRKKLEKRFPDVHDTSLTVEQILSTKGIYPAYNSGSWRFEKTLKLV
jgi:hypothetical protein